MRMRRPKYTHGFIDRHGKPRFYLRRPGHKKVPLPGLPWSEPFMRAYQAALLPTEILIVRGSCFETRILVLSPP
jgi:hypothetical protein